MKGWIALLALVVSLGAPAANLESRLAAEEGVRAIKRLQLAYAHLLDAGEWRAVSDLFADAGVLERPEGIVRGRAAIRRHLETAAGGLDVHLPLQPIVTLDRSGRSGKATWHEFALLGGSGVDARWQGGIHENEYVLERGVWKIARLRWFPQYGGSFDDFGHRAPARWDIPYHFTAAHVGVSIPADLEDGAEQAARGAAPGRIQRLADETAVRNLQHAYGYYLDRKQWDDVADLFAKRGTAHFASRGGYVGPERIRGAFERWFGTGPLATGELFDHLQLATLVTVSADGRHAAARTLELAMLGRMGEFARWQLGVYENSFVKEGGTWKLAALRYFPRFSTDYDLGWARDVQPLPGPDAELRPDLPPLRGFAAFPANPGVAFHFTHPVTGRPIRQSGSVAPVPLLASARAKPVAAGAGSLEARLEAEIGVDAVENLMSSYGYYIDESAWDEMADTYASRGEKEITGAGVYVGPERIRKVLKLRGPDGGRTPNFFTIHQLTQPVIHVASDGRSARARMRLFQAGGAADGSSGSWIGGIYENTAVVENGEWKFGVQDLHHTFNASYRNGWARVGAARGKPLAGRVAGPRDETGGGMRQGLGGAASPNRFATEFPPDRPIRARQYAFPEIVEPAFHYRNPVSGRAPPELLP